MNFELRVNPNQAAELRDYVYIYYDKVTGDPFYIGRGKGGRLLSHLSHSHNDLVRERLSREQFELDFLAFGLDEETAKKVEAAAIDLIGIENLLNRTRGSGAIKYGRIKAHKLLQALEDEEITEVPHNLVVVQIGKTYQRYGDDEQALYESTRGAWVIRPEVADKAEYVAGVVAGRIVYVMSIAAWLPAGSTQYFINTEPKPATRIEFVGTTATPEIQKLYVGRRIQLNTSDFTVPRPVYYGPFAGREILRDGVWQSR